MDYKTFRGNRITVNGAVYVWSQYGKINPFDKAEKSGKYEFYAVIKEEV